MMEQRESQKIVSEWLGHASVWIKRVFAAKLVRIFKFAMLGHTVGFWRKDLKFIWRLSVEIRSQIRSSPPQEGYQTPRFSYRITFVPKWRNGRRAGLKNRSGQPGVSSTLTFGTTHYRHEKARRPKSEGLLLWPNHQTLTNR